MTPTKVPTKNRGVHTNGRVENIQDELRTVIDLMGPESQDLSTTTEASDSTTLNTSIIEV